VFGKEVSFPSAHPLIVESSVTRVNSGNGCEW
jgi:hypothetical protein